MPAKVYRRAENFNLLLSDFAAGSFFFANEENNSKADMHQRVYPGKQGNDPLNKYQIMGNSFLNTPFIWDELLMHENEMG